MTDQLDRAADAVRDGELVVYPTETVYGLGADALAGAAVEAVFEAKERDREEPISMAVPDVDTACEFTVPTARERAFMQQFLPGPVTVVLEATGQVPAVLTAGRERVGIRIPDHDVALELLERVAPVTATSANVSGEPSAQQPADLDARVRERATVVLEDGATPGGGSTVVNVSEGHLHRRGANAAEIEAWLAER